MKKKNINLDRVQLYAQLVNSINKNQVYVKLKSPTALTVSNLLKHLKTQYLKEIPSKQTLQLCQNYLRQLLSQTLKLKTLKTVWNCSEIL